MIAPQRGRVLAYSVVGSDWWWLCLSRKQQRGQDKSRNVRAVGCGEICSNNNILGHIPDPTRTLLFPVSGQYSSAFRTLPARA